MHWILLAEDKSYGNLSIVADNFFPIITNIDSLSAGALTGGVTLKYSVHSVQLNVYAHTEVSIILMTLSISTIE